MSERRWAAALLLLEDWVEQVEHLSRSDDWTTVPACYAPLTDEPVPAELTPRARAVAARLSRLENRLRALRDESTAELAELDARRHAARHYTRSIADGLSPDAGT